LKRLSSIDFIWNYLQEYHFLEFQTSDAWVLDGYKRIRRPLTSFFKLLCLTQPKVCNETLQFDVFREDSLDKEVRESDIFESHSN